jgi:hypothetical protein
LAKCESESYTYISSPLNLEGSESVLVNANNISSANGIGFDESQTIGREEWEEWEKELREWNKGTSESVMILPKPIATPLPKRERIPLPLPQLQPLEKD